MNRLEKTCLAGLATVPIAISTIAFALLTTPASTPCAAIDQSTVSAALRIYCAQQQAQRNTPENLAAAIRLLESVQTDDPYRPQIDRLIQQWSSAILTQAETEVQAGQLEKGIAIARLLPQSEKIQSWRSLWEKGEGLIETTLDQVEKREWRQALQTADQLRQFENQYWVEQYDWLVKRIQSDRELRDPTLKNPTEPHHPPEAIDPKLPEPKIVTRSVREVYDDAAIARPVEPSEPQPSPEPERPEPDAEISPSEATDQIDRNPV